MPRISCKPAVRPVPLLVALALATGCGPTTREASIAALVVAGAIVVLANALVWPLWRLWRRVRPELDFRWRPSVAIGLGLSALGLLAAALPYEGRMAQWLGIGLWLAGTSYMTLFLLVWRIRVPAPNGLAWAHAIAGALVFLPAVPLAFVGSTQGELHDALMFVWVLPGYGGWVSGPLYVLLLIEALVRWRRASSRQRQ